MLILILSFFIYREKFTDSIKGVDSKEDVDAWYTKLVDNEIDVIGPTNHDDWIYSIYFFDPNNLRLEITTRLGPPEVTKHIGIIVTEFKNILSNLLILGQMIENSYSINMKFFTQFTIVIDYFINFE